jgi:hypothetical protein
MTTPSSSTISLNAPVEHTGGFEMERTPSGTIISDKTFEPRHNNNTLICSDEEAACRVKRHFRRLPPHGKHERILRTLIESRVLIDKDALDSILIGADTVFFDGALAGRVRWEWSNSSQPCYETELIGTTALRPASQGGFETLIVLSEPILCHSGFDQRLLLSAFLHELVHCYLFISCGFEARDKGGHTEGFHRIAGIIDDWVGGGYLQLCNMKANLNFFRTGRLMRVMDPCIEGLREGRHSHEGCNQSPRPELDYLEDLGMVRHAGTEGWQ